MRPRLHRGRQRWPSHPVQDYFTLNDGVGLQAFVLVASQKPLPPYGEWKARVGPLPWRSTSDGGIWRYDGQWFEPLGRDVRGGIRPQLRGAAGLHRSLPIPQGSTRRRCNPCPGLPGRAEGRVRSRTMSGGDPRSIPSEGANRGALAMQINRQMPHAHCAFLFAGALLLGVIGSRAAQPKAPTVASPSEASPARRRLSGDEAKRVKPLDAKGDELDSRDSLPGPGPDAAERGDPYEVQGPVHSDGRGPATPGPDARSPRCRPERGRDWPKR